MNESMNRTAEKAAQKILEEEVYKGLELQPTYSTQCVFDLNRYQNQECFESSIRFGNMEFFSETTPTFLERMAQRQAMKNAYIELTKLNWEFDSKYKNSEEDMKSLVNMEIDDCCKYLTDDTLAILFKDLVRHLSYHKSFKIDKYTTRICHEGGLTGYTAELTFNGETFKSLGLMIDENQAQQSAAEICLRTLGYLPTVTCEEDLLIQPYHGGLPIQVDGITNDKSYIFTSTLSSDVLEAFIYSRGMMQLPKYYVKEVESQSDEEPDDEAEKIMECICYIDGKLFKASTPHTLRIAIQLAADEAIKYFGILYPQESMELRKHIRLHRYDFYREAYLPCDRQPSKIDEWVWTRFCRPYSYNEYVDAQSLVYAIAKSGVVMSNLPSWEYQQTLVKGEITRIPSFKGNNLSEIEDVCVAEIDAKNPSLLTIGNSEFSIKMLCSHGKIYSTHRSCDVDILPGHNIRKLKCEYRASIPSLEVHLKAIDCQDLYYPNPPKPVVTSCGVVVLFHDYSASPTDIHVLLQRRTARTTFEMKISLLQSLLQKLIQPVRMVDVTPAECMEGIVNWKQNEVKLLSEMTMDSVYSLMSNYGEYDTRWNELFAKRELPDQLKEIQDISLNELKRREEEGTSEEGESDTTLWALPQSEFMSRFEPVGIQLEESKLCGMRALAESTGLKISLGDIEKCSTVDIPVMNEEKQHRGNVSRYYIWNQIETGTMKEEEELEEKLSDGYQLFDKRVIEHGMRRYIYSLDEEKRAKYLDHVHYLNTDGTRKRRLGEGLEKDDDSAEEGTPSHEESSNDISLDLPLICLPQDPGFESHKNSLKQYCALKELGIPKYFRKKWRGKLVCTVKFGTYLFDSEPGHGKFVEEDASREALQSLGYLKGASNNGNVKEEANVQEVDPYSITTEEVANNESMEDEVEIVDPYSIISKESREGDHSVARDRSIARDRNRARPEEEEKEKDRGVQKKADWKSASTIRHRSSGASRRKRKNAKMRRLENNTVDAAKDQTAGNKGQDNKGRTLLPGRRQEKLEIVYPRRDAVREQCVWMTLDEAIDVCPVLEKIAETAQFLEQLNKLVLEANEFLESINIKESVKTSLLPVT